MFHVSLRRLEDDPCSTDGCQKRPWYSMERVKIAAVDDPASQVGNESSYDYLQKHHHPPNVYPQEKLSLKWLNSSWNFFSQAYMGIARLAPLSTSNTDKRH